MPQLTVKFFAAAADAAGTREAEVAVPEGSALRDVLAAAREQYPAAASVIEQSAVFIQNRHEPNLDRPVEGLSAIDVLPPFAGG